MPQMLRSGLMGYLCRSLAVAGAMLVAMAAGSAASAFDIKKVEASVYKVFATPKGSTGTGFLVSGRRTVITNFHVIEKNTEFMVIYRDGKEVQVAAARVIAYKPNLDLAVLRVDRDLPGTALTLAEFEPDKLTNVVTVGFPAAADDAVKGRPLTVPELIQRLKDPTALDPTVTTGVVSRMTSAESPAQCPHRAAQRRDQSRQQRRPAVRQVRQRHGREHAGCLELAGTVLSIHASEVVRILRETGVEYAAVRTPCLTAEGGGGGMMIPLVLGMSAALAFAALVFALRSGRHARRPQQGREPVDHAAGQALAAGLHARGRPAQPIRALEPRPRRLSLLSTGGGKSYLARWRTGVDGWPGTPVPDHHRRRHSVLQPCPPAIGCTGPACRHHRSQFVERHVPQRQAHHQRARPGRRHGAVRHRRVSAGGRWRLRCHRSHAALRT